MAKSECIPVHYTYIHGQHKTIRLHFAQRPQHFIVHYIIKTISLHHKDNRVLIVFLCTIHAVIDDALFSINVQVNKQHYLKVALDKYSARSNSLRAMFGRIQVYRV